MSTLVLDALGIPHKLGEEVTLEINVHGKTRTDTFVLCGFWEGDPLAMAQEILVSKDYCLEAAPLETTPFCETDGMDYSGYMNVNFNFSNSFNIEGKMDDLIERCGFDPARVDPAVNWGYGFSSVDPTSLTLIVVLLLLIMLSGYLIIYNIFYLNIFSDIRFYGLLKTVGTTGKQLRKLVRRQAWALCLFGVPAGLVIGWIIGRFLTPVVIGMLNQVTPTYSLNPLVFIGSALFTIITVYISCIKPCRIAAKVSPVEAARYTEKKRRTKKTKRATPFFMALSNLGRSTRKLVLVILSLSLSVILLNSVYTIVTGFDMDKFIASYLLSDCVVSDVSIYNNMLGYRNTHGVTKDFQQELSARDDITEIGNIYVQPVLYTWSDEEWADIERFMNAPEMQDTVNDPILKDVYDEIRSARQSQLYVYGVDEMAAGLISLKEGTLDWKKFSSGNYVIVNAWNSSEADGNFDRPFLEPGDKVTLDFEQGGAKEYEVMAVGQLPSALSMQASTLIGEEFILPDTG